MWHHIIDLLEACLQHRVRLDGADDLVPASEAHVAAVARRLLEGPVHQLQDLLIILILIVIIIILLLIIIVISLLFLLLLSNIVISTKYKVIIILNMVPNMNTAIISSPPRSTGKSSAQRVSSTIMKHNEASIIYQAVVFVPS